MTIDTENNLTDYFITHHPIMKNGIERIKGILNIFSYFCYCYYN